MRTEGKIAAFGANGVECCGRPRSLATPCTQKTVRTPGMRARRLRISTTRTACAETENFQTNPRIPANSRQQ